MANLMLMLVHVNLKQSQTEIAVTLKITQPAVSKKMKEIRKIVGKAIGKA